jgi:formylglycine-generating enzyme required for sulfatase activity
MKCRFLISIMFLLVVVQPALPQEASAPLGKDQVLDLVKFGLDSGELAKRIRERGIDFDPTDDYIETLRKAGAQGAVIHALLEARPKPLTREQVGKLVAGGVPSQRAVMLVKQHGIDFVADERYLQTLRVAGGDDALVAALREANAAVTALRENSKDGLKYIWIPPGTFMMGCSPGDQKCKVEENPPHRVTIANGFWMGQTEVTVTAYRKFAESTGAQMPPAPTFNADWKNQDMPIVRVTWEDATTFCGWAGGRLPTEAEWEYAARTGSTEARYGPIDEVAWYGANSGGHTHEVAQKHANGFGLFDMLGNVYEWVNDWYDQNYYQSSPSQDPPGPSSGQFRVLRGGCWFHDSDYARVSYRFRFIPTDRDSVNGFRCGGNVFAH